MHFRYKLALLENSSITGESNIQFITNYLNYFGLYVYSFALKAEEYKSPIRRERQYFIILSVSCFDTVKIVAVGSPSAVSAASILPSS